MIKTGQQQAQSVAEMRTYVGTTTLVGLDVSVGSGAGGVCSSRLALLILLFLLQDGGQLPGAEGREYQQWTHRQHHRESKAPGVLDRKEAPLEGQNIKTPQIVTRNGFSRHSVYFVSCMEPCIEQGSCAPDANRARD